jgi:hypothetical protein
MIESKEGEVVASFTVDVTVRAAQGSPIIPTNAQLEALVVDAIQNNSLANGMGDYTVTATASSRRTDR